jgi:hypothetical protein
MGFQHQRTLMVTALCQHSVPQRLRCTPIRMPLSRSQERSSPSLLPPHETRTTIDFLGAFAFSFSYLSLFLILRTALVFA